MKTISKIIIYPIKSLNGISVPSAKLTPAGFNNDRKFMLVDVIENKMITLREFPDLYKLNVRFITNDLIQIENKNKDQKPLLINLNHLSDLNDNKKVKIWDDLVEVQHVYEEANDWFSNELGIKCQLVQMAPNFLRQVDLRFAPPGQCVLFADGFPYLICAESTLNLINNHLEKQVSMIHFRPNIVVKGTQPNEEYNWSSININNQTFCSFKPCARCKIISIYPDSREINDEIIPLMAKKFNQQNKIIFGINACWQNNMSHAELKVGDVLTSVNKTNL
jgi:uncharacterized protein YcbX